MLEGMLPTYVMSSASGGYLLGLTGAASKQHMQGTGVR